MTHETIPGRMDDDAQRDGGRVRPEIDGWRPNTAYGVGFELEALWPPQGHILFSLFHEARNEGGWKRTRYKALIDFFAPEVAVESPTATLTDPGSCPADRDGGRVLDREEIALKEAIWKAGLPFQTELLETGGVTFRGLTNAIADAILALPQAETADGGLSQAARDVLAERRRQVEVEGWTAEHDDGHTNHDLAAAAACYASHAAAEDETRALYGPGSVFTAWRWDARDWQPGTRREDLVKAAALILAGIERLDRANPPGAEGGA